MTADFATERARAQAAIAAGKVRPGEPWAPVAHLYRKTDPNTSRQAAEHVTAIGSRADHLKRIVQAVAEHPGHTSAELAGYTGLERHEAARRTADAANAGLIGGQARRAAWAEGQRSHGGHAARRRGMPHE